MKKRLISIIMILALTASALTACTKSKPKEAEGERTLRIASPFQMGDDGGQYLRQQFTEIFEYANPNIKLEFVPTTDPSAYFNQAKKEGGEKPADPIEKFKEVLNGQNPPDVVLLDLNQLKQLAGENLLAPLDPSIAKDKFNTSDIVPAVLDGLKGASPDGKLYGLSPTFFSSALIYNKKLFDDAGVQYPTDNMTWDQTFDLARRLSKGEGDKRVYGFNFQPYPFGDLYNSSFAYTQPLQLHIWDDKAEKMTVDSDQWEKVWKTLVQLQTDKIAPEAPDRSNPNGFAQAGEHNPFKDNLFLSGRLAMTVISYGELAQIDNANKNVDRYPGFSKIDYNVVTTPSHPEQPGVVAGIGFNGIMGINAKAANAADAWKFIKFINSEEWARSKAKDNFQLVSRKSFIKPKDGSDLHIEAFYNIKPAVNDQIGNYKLYVEKPNLQQIPELGRTEFQAAAQGKKTVRDALKSWQTQGDALLQQNAGAGAGTGAGGTNNAVESSAATTTR